MAQEHRGHVRPRDGPGPGAYGPPSSIGRRSAASPTSLAFSISGRMPQRETGRLGQGPAQSGGVSAFGRQRQGVRRSGAAYSFGGRHKLRVSEDVRVP